MSNEEKILRILLDAESDFIEQPVPFIKSKLENVDDDEIESALAALKSKGLIHILYADDKPAIVETTNAAKSYFGNKRKNFINDIKRGLSGIVLKIILAIITAYILFKLGIKTGT